MVPTTVQTINWNKYLCKPTNQTRNRYLNVLIIASFQGVNGFFNLSFRDVDCRESYKQYYLATVQIKDYNVMIDGRKFFDQPIKNGWKDCNGKIAKGQRDDYTTEFIFKKYYKLIAIDLSRQRKPNADSKAIQQINFSGNLDWVEVAAMYFIIDEAKEIAFHFSKGAVKVLWFHFVLVKY